MLHRGGPRALAAMDESEEASETSQEGGAGARAAAKQLGRSAGRSSKHAREKRHRRGTQRHRRARESEAEWKAKRSRQFQARHAVLGLVADPSREGVYHRSSEALVLAQDLHSVTVLIHAGQVLTWEFDTRYYNIAFSVLFDGKEIHRDPRPDCHRRTVFGVLRAEASGVVVLQWDNRTSYLHSKKLYYRLQCYDPDIEPPEHVAALLQAQQASSSGAWAPAAASRLLRMGRASPQQSATTVAVTSTDALHRQSQQSQQRQQQQEQGVGARGPVQQVQGMISGLTYYVPTSLPNKCIMQ